MTSSAMNPITEDDIADFLLNTPDFFGRHAELLSAVLLTSPHGNRAVSLQERQAEMLREKIKLLEHRIMDMIRHGNENMIISDRLQRWARRLFRTASPQALPHAMAEGLQEEFMVPQVAVKVWGVADALAGEPFALGVSNDVKSLASSLMAPYVGANLDVMRSDTQKQRPGRPFVFSDLNRLTGVEEIVAFIEKNGGLAAA